jgi:hypothetical protein
MVCGDGNIQVYGNERRDFHFWFIHFSIAIMETCGYELNI